MRGGALLFQNKIFVIFAIACLALNLVGYTLYLRNQDIITSQDWVMHTYKVQRQTRRVLLDLQDMESGQRGYLLTGDKNYLATYQNGRDAVQKTLGVLKELTRDNPDQVRRIALIAPIIQQLSDKLAEGIDQLDNGGVVPLENVHESKRLMGDIRHDMEDLLQTENKLLELRDQESAQRRKEFIQTLLVTAGLSGFGLIAATLSLIFLQSRSKVTESKLQRSEENWALAMEALNDGLFDYNVIDGTIYISPRLKEMLGYSNDELPNTLEAFNQLIHPDDKELMQDVMRRYDEGQTSHYQNVFRMLHKDGRYRWHLARGKGIWNKQGDIARMIGAHTDITDQKQIEEHLRAINQELENFTYIASHDLRSPLVNLKGFASEMGHSLEDAMPVIDKMIPMLDAKDRTLLDGFKQDIPEALHFIQSAVTRMDRLTSSLLDLSRIGKRRIVMDKVNMRELVQRIVDSLAHDIQTHNIHLTLGALPDVTSDALLIEQILGNILDNAVKYLDPSRPGRIHIEGRHLHDQTLFEIRDNGRGIAEKDRQKVFEFFRRAANASDVRGEGMGMAFVKAMIKRLGGQIWFTSTVGEGTVFYFTLADRLSNDQLQQL